MDPQNVQPLPPIFFLTEANAVYGWQLLKRIGRKSARKQIVSYFKFKKEGIHERAI